MNELNPKVSKQPENKEIKLFIGNEFFGYDVTPIYTHISNPFYDEKKEKEAKKLKNKSNICVDKYINVKEVKKLLEKYNHQCIYCHKILHDDFTLDRVNNNTHIHIKIVL